MITKKDWDNIPLAAKREILGIMFGKDFENYSKPKKLLYEYHHNFDFDDTGKLLKKVLQCLYRTSIDTINVRVDVCYSPTDGDKFIPSPIVKKTSKKANSLTLKRWKCDYTDKYGDLSHAWCHAYTKDEARDIFLSEYWDIHEIIQIYEIK